MRLIDADALKQKLLAERDAIPLTYTERYGFGVEFPSSFGQARRGGVKTALRCMEQTPTIDAVPVVRCRDCKHYTYPRCGYGICKIHSDGGSSEAVYMCDNDFCSYGERKDGDTDG